MPDASNLAPPRSVASPGPAAVRGALGGALAAVGGGRRARARSRRGASARRRAVSTAAPLAAAAILAVAALSLGAVYVRLLGYTHGGDVLGRRTDAEAIDALGPNDGGDGGGGGRGGVLPRGSVRGNRSAASPGGGRAWSESEPEPAKSPAGAGAGAGNGAPGRPSGRFPRFGTEEFSRRCRWLLDAAEKGSSPRPDGSNCTFYHTPGLGNEGVSFWVTQIVSSHLLAVQAGCRLLFDYGPRVDVGQVLLVPPEARRRNWTVPVGFDCDADPNCREITPKRWKPETLRGKTVAAAKGLAGRDGKKRLIPVPRYRYAYGLERFRRTDAFAAELRGALPGFDVGDGMACSLGVLFRLAPTAARFEPDLFTDILPTLRDEEALVVGIYARTGWADDRARAEPSKMKGKLLSRNGTDTDVPGRGTEEAYRADVERVVNAALAIEQRFLTGKSDETRRDRAFSRIVWMVTTDWPDAKGWIAKMHNGSDANANIPQEERKYPSRAITRRVITTQSRGTHTRTRSKPATADFAGALLDWWLLGETDLVVKWRYSFAETAALRTATDVYQGRRHKPLLAEPCARVVVYERDGSIEDVDPEPGPGGEVDCDPGTLLTYLGPSHKNPRDV